MGKKIELTEIEKNKIIGLFSFNNYDVTIDISYIDYKYSFSDNLIYEELINKIVTKYKTQNNFIESVNFEFDYRWFNENDIVNMFSDVDELTNSEIRKSYFKSSKRYNNNTHFINQNINYRSISDCGTLIYKI